MSLSFGRFYKSRNPYEEKLENYLKTNEIVIIIVEFKRKLYFLRFVRKNKKI